MNPNDVAPMIVGMTLILVGGGVVLLRPITRRLGDYLETITRARRQEPPAVEPRVMETLERIEDRLRMLEERQDFTDALLRRGEESRKLGAAGRDPKLPRAQP